MSLVKNDSQQFSFCKLFYLMIQTRWWQHFFFFKLKSNGNKDSLRIWKNKHENMYIKFSSHYPRSRVKEKLFSGFWLMLFMAWIFLHSQNPASHLNNKLECFFMLQFFWMKVKYFCFINLEDLYEHIEANEWSIRSKGKI